jgi:hypothetical protein
MSDFGVPAAYAVLIWWFTTGIILFLDGLPPRTFRWSMLGASIGLVGAANMLRSSASDVSAHGAYTACRDRCTGWAHFVHATQAIIYNELATLGLAIAVAAATWKMPNRVALWTFLILWAMRLSAKLNLFLGVPNLGEKFLPAHLQYLKGFFRKRAMNGLFPVSVSASTIVTAWLVQRFLGAQSPFETTAYALTTSLLGLAVVEHWFMVLPLPSERLWSWAFRSGNSERSPDAQDLRITVKAP